MSPSSIHAPGNGLKELIAQERPRTPSYGGRSGSERGHPSAKIGHGGDQ
jgi:hypothetical protein